MTTELRRMDDKRMTDLETKVDQILEKVLSLPCKEGFAMKKAIEKDVSWLQKIVYTILCFGIPSLLGLAVVWGSLGTTVQRNTSILEKHDFDITTIKAKSYGYRGIKVMTDDTGLGMRKV